MRAQVVLTVSESKRLIAKGVAALDYVQDKLQKGIIVVASGSTNAYVYEELTGQSIDKRVYVTGRVTPAERPPSWKIDRMAPVVLVNGQPDADLDQFSALAKMSQGDIFVKGANALNYGANLAGIAIGHPTGGTIGRALGPIIAKKLRLLLPVGLEKEVPFSLQDASEILAEEDDALGTVHSLWPVSGTIVTELEAIYALFGVTAYPIGAGGIAGAEGAVRLLLVGPDQDVADAVALIKDIQGEPPLV